MMSEVINFEDFKKIQLVVGQIISAEPIKNSEKLLKLLVDLGDEKRQIIAGIGKDYNSDTLVNQQIIVVENLEPRKIFGFESQGMLLAASSDDKPIIISPSKNAKLGSKIS